MIQNTRSAIALLIAALREIFDESAYARFLARNRIVSSPSAYAAFRRENELGKARRPRCC
jgi:hypothetical protein